MTTSSDQGPDRAARSSRRRSQCIVARLVTGAFWVLAAIVLTNGDNLNLGPVATLGPRVTNALSFGALLCCLPLAGNAYYVPLRQALGVPGVLVLGALGSYLAIGFGVSVAIGGSTAELSYELARYGYVMLLIGSGALGGQALVSRIGSARLLDGILVILMASCAMILASPLLIRVPGLLEQAPPLAFARWRSTGAFFGPEPAGLVACITAALALALLAAGRRRGLAYAGLTVGCAAVIDSFSRTALLGLVVLIAYFLVLHRGGGRRALLTWLAAAALAGLVAYATVDAARLAVQRQMERIGYLVALPDRDGNQVTTRLTLWQLGLEQIRQSPVVGSGLGRMTNLEGAQVNAYGERTGVHNQYLWLAGEAGIVPLALYLLFLFSLLRLCRTAPHSPARDAVVGWAFLIALHSLFHYLLGLPFLAFLIGVSCALAVSARTHPAAVCKPEQESASPAGTAA